MAGTDIAKCTNLACNNMYCNIRKIDFFFINKQHKLGKASLWSQNRLDSFLARITQGFRNIPLIFSSMLTRSSQNL